MNPYKFIHQSVKPTDKLLSLCSGIGLEFPGVQTEDITAVDVSARYLVELMRKFPHIKAVNSDAVLYAEAQDDNSFDIVTLIDGLEHITKPRGKRLLKNIKRIAKRQVILFVPQGHNDDGYLKNEPHNAWDIDGQDEFQTHKSGWTEEEILKYGFELVAKAIDTSQHGEPYTALMFVYNK